MSIPKWSNTGTVLRLKGQGRAAADGNRGDEYVTLKVMLPERPIRSSKNSSPSGIRRRLAIPREAMGV